MSEQRPRKRRQRRAKGEGTTRKRSDGRWERRVPVGQDAEGKTVYKSFYGASQKEAVEKADVYRKQHPNGPPPKEAGQTLNAFLRTWFATVQQTKKQRTAESYADMIALHIDPHLGHIALDKLNPQHIQAWLNELAEKLTPKGTPLSARVIQYARAILHVALNRAVKWQLIPRNVVSLVEAPRVEKARIEPLTEAQARALLVAVEGHRLAALYHTALGLGLRQGELIALHWADVDLEVRTLKVVRAKSEAGERTLALPEGLCDVLRMHWQLQKEERRDLGLDWKEHGLVFPSDVGTPLSPRNLVRHFKSMLEKVGLPDTIRFHDLRHSCASFLIAQGTHPRVVMEILGHSQISVTMNTYGHVAIDGQREAMDKVQEKLRRLTKDEKKSGS